MQTQFQLIAGHVVLDFANTLDYRFDAKRRVDLLLNYADLLEFSLQSGIVTGQQVRRLLGRTRDRDARLALSKALELREHLDSLFRSLASGIAPSRSNLRVLNHFLATARVQERIVLRGADFVRTYGDLGDKPDGPVWPIADAAASLLTSADRAHIRECNEPSCRWLFLDHSKNHSRCWCDMKICGNRSKVRRFRARQNTER